MYNTLDTSKVTELSILRHGWLSPEYELTDSSCSYGKMRYSGISKRKPVIETATDGWSFAFEGFFRNDVLILDKNGVLVGKLANVFFSTKYILTMENGFTARFRKVSLFSRDTVWESDEHGLIMQINNPLFTTKYTVSIAPSPAPQAIIPLLIFLGTHRIIVDQQKRAAR